MANCLPPYDPATAGAIGEQKFYQTFVALMAHKYKDSYAAAAEILGMILAYMEEKQHVGAESLCMYCADVAHIIFIHICVYIQEYFFVA